MERTTSVPLQPPTYGNSITILSIDGGGIRGLIPGTILNFLESELQVSRLITTFITSVVNIFHRSYQQISMLHKLYPFVHSNFVSIKSLINYSEQNNIHWIYMHMDQLHAVLVMHVKGFMHATNLYVARLFDTPIFVLLVYLTY